MCTVSIIVPTRHRRMALERTLSSLLQCCGNSTDYEVLVVDNGFDHQVQEVVEYLFQHCNGAAKYLREPVPGLLSGRHRGAREASGEVLAFLDDDVRLGPNWMTTVQEVFGESDTAVLGGPSIPLFESEPPEWLQSFYTENDQARSCTWLSLLDGGREVKEIDPLYVWGLNFGIRKKTLFDLGGFHPDSLPKSLQRYQGDGETGLSLKMKRVGLKALYHPGVAVQHEVPAARLTIEYFEQRAFFQGVCDSYTQIRAERAVKEPAQSWKDPLRKIRQILRRAVGSQGALDEARRRTVRAYQAGGRFHRNEVKRDPSLLNWVCKENYFDYHLPEGWQKYLSPAELKTTE